MYFWCTPTGRDFPATRFGEVNLSPELERTSFYTRQGEKKDETTPSVRHHPRSVGVSGGQGNLVFYRRPLVDHPHKEPYRTFEKVELVLPNVFRPYPQIFNKKRLLLGPTRERERERGGRVG